MVIVHDSVAVARTPNRSSAVLTCPMSCIDVVTRTTGFLVSTGDRNIESSPANSLSISRSFSSVVSGGGGAMSGAILSAERGRTT